MKGYSESKGKGANFFLLFFLKRSNKKITNSKMSLARQENIFTLQFMIEGTTKKYRYLQCN
jgi:hypothetical protein